MSHFHFLNFTELSEDDWDCIYNLAQQSLKNKINDYRAILSFKENLLNKKSSDHRYSEKRIKHVLGAESGFVNKKLNLNTNSHSELLAYYNITIFDDYKLDIIEALKNGDIDIYVSYYTWFIDAIFVDYLPLDILKKVVIDLCQKSSSEIDKNIELLSLFATIEILDGNVKKGLAIYDDLFSRDQFNVLMYLRLLEALEHIEDYDNLNKYANLAMDVAISLDDDVACELIQISLDEAQEALNEDTNELSLENIINSNIPSNEIQNTLLKLALQRYPEEGKVVLDENLSDKAKENEYNIIMNYCKTCLKILQDTELKEKFLKLLEEHDEICAVNQIMEFL